MRISVANAMPSQSDPEPILRGKPHRRHADHHRVVGRQHDVDEHDLAERDQRLDAAVTDERFHGLSALLRRRRKDHQGRRLVRGR